ncbi:MAG: HNH endonuclease [Bacteroidales bacterium]
MQFVTTVDQIKENAIRFDQYRLSQNHTENTRYAAMMAEGICFLTFYHGGKTVFAPSRFAGYKDNNLQKHDNNKKKHGRDTNKAIERALGSTPTVDDACERRFKRFCEQNKISIAEKGAFGRDRKFWPVIEAEQALTYDILGIIDRDDQDSPTTKQTLIDARLGQGAFRSALIKYWVTCAVTGCSNIAVLRASHIKPWAHCDDSERLDQFNGLLLSPNLDTSFDAGLITFSDRGLMIISNQLSYEDQNKLGLNSNMTIRLDKLHLPYMRHHRNNIFKR